MKIIIKTAEDNKTIVCNVMSVLNPDVIEVTTPNGHLITYKNIPPKYIEIPNNCSDGAAKRRRRRDR